MTDRLSLAILTVIFTGIWIGFSIFMVLMTLNYGGFSDGQFSYGNLIGLLMWQVFGVCVCLPMLYDLITYKREINDN